MKNRRYFLISLFLSLALAVLPLSVPLQSNDLSLGISTAVAAEETAIDLSSEDPVAVPLDNGEEDFTADDGAFYDEEYDGGYVTDTNLEDSAEFIEPRVDAELGIEGISAELDDVSSAGINWLPVTIVFVALIIAGAVAVFIALRKPKPKL